ncbi:MAG TPA: hypothetical protein VHN99_06210, partial [Deinococcales bacterium]|nr:hypothetical protein [Deinococcales bacterium]
VNAETLQERGRASLDSVEGSGGSRPPEPAETAPADTPTPAPLPNSAGAGGLRSAGLTGNANVTFGAAADLMGSPATQVARPGLARETGEDNLIDPDAELPHRE